MVLCLVSVAGDSGWAGLGLGLQRFEGISLGKGGTPAWMVYMGISIGVWAVLGLFSAIGAYVRATG